MDGLANQPLSSNPGPFGIPSSSGGGGLTSSMLSGIAGLAAALFPDTTTTNSSGNTNTSGSTSGNMSGSSTPTMSTLQQMLSQMFGAGAMNQFSNIPGVVNATKVAGEQSIGANESAAQNSISNTLAARGLAYSPYAGTAMAQPAISAAAQQNQLAASLPLLNYSLTQSGLGGLESAMSATGPLGTSTTGSTNTSSTGQSTTNQNTTQTNQGIFGSL